MLKMNTIKLIKRPPLINIAKTVEINYSNGNKKIKKLLLCKKLINKIMTYLILDAKLTFIFLKKLWTKALII